MKAITINTYGGPLSLEEIPVPSMGPEELLIQVKYATVNHLDIVKASGNARQIFPIDLPWVPGHEFSGIVAKVGQKVQSFAEGDAVFGNVSQGAYAEYLVVNPSTVTKMPSNLSFAEAASVPVAAQTAWQGIFQHGHLSAGQTILIHGGAGAVGAYAVQLAHYIGATVIVTASAADEAFLATLGASQVIDYQTTKFENALKSKVDVVFDLIGGDVQKRSYTVLNTGGYLIAANQPVSQEEAAKYHVSALLMNMTPSEKGLRQIAELLEQGNVKTDIAGIYSLKDISKAWNAIGDNPASGKREENDTTQKKRHGKILIQIAE